MAVISTNAYGDLDLQSYAYRWFGDLNDSGSCFGFSFQTNKGTYTFIPDTYISQGVKTSTKQYYSKIFLDKTVLTDIYKNYQPLDFGGFKDFDGGDIFYQRLKEYGYGTSGILVPEDWTVKNFTKSDSVQNYALNRSVGDVQVGGIEGMGEKDGSLIYIPKASGADKAVAYISGSNTYTIWQPKLEWYQKIAKEIAKIPLFPEIASAAFAIITAPIGLSSYTPYLYAALKGASLGAQGVDPLKAGLMIGIDLAAQNLASNTDFAKSIGASFGATTSAAQLAIGKAVIGASVNGIKAAASGKDVTDAMVQGALTSGADSMVAGISKNALGSNYQSIVDNIAKNTNLTNTQIQSIIASSVVSGITSEIKGGNFAEAFGNSLVSGGISRSLANEVGSTVEGNVSPEVRSAIVVGTAAVTKTATNAMLNGKDIGAALEANLPSTIYSTMAAYTEEKDRQAKNTAAVKAGWNDYGQQTLAESKYGAGITPDQYAFNEAKTTQKVTQETTQQETQPEGIASVTPTETSTEKSPEGIATLPTEQTVEQPTIEEPVQVAEETVKPVEEETLTDLTQLVTTPEATKPTETKEEVVPVSSAEGTTTIESQLTPSTTEQTTTTVTEPTLSDLVKDVIEVPETVKPVNVEEFKPSVLEPTVVSPRTEEIMEELLASEGEKESSTMDLINREENVPYGYFVDFDGTLKPFSELLSTDKSVLEKPTTETTTEPEQQKKVKVDTLGNVYDTNGNFIGYASDFGMKMSTDPLTGNVVWETEDGNVIKASPFGDELATPGPAAGSVLPESPIEFPTIGDQEGDYPMQIINNPDGSVTSVEADGSSYTFNADGSVTYTDPEGNSSVFGEQETQESNTSSYDFKLSNLADSLIGSSSNLGNLNMADYNIPFVPAIAGGAAFQLLGESGQESYNPYSYDPMSFAWNPLAVQAPIDGVARGQQFFEPTYSINAAGGGLMSIQPVQYIQPTVPSEMITNTMTVKQDPTSSVQMYNQGGISTLGSYSDGGRMLKGPGDGMSDDIPATIAGRQPARLANEEFVIPADVVSHLGNGSSEAGAKVLYKMMAEVRKARTGKTKQARQIHPERYMPRG